MAKARSLRRRARAPREAKAAVDIRKAAQRYGKRAIEALWEIAAAAESDSARIAAIKEILDRGYGKESRAASSETEQAIIKRIERIIVDPKD